MLSLAATWRVEFTKDRRRNDQTTTNKHYISGISHSWRKPARAKLTYQSRGINKVVFPTGEPTESRIAQLQTLFSFATGTGGEGKWAAHPQCAVASKQSLQLTAGTLGSGTWVDKAHYSGIEGEGRSDKESVELERGVGAWSWSWRAWSWSVELELESVELAANVLSEHRQDVQRLGWWHLRIFWYECSVFWCQIVLGTT